VLHFFFKEIANLLSQNILTGLLFKPKFKLSTKCLIHTALLNVVIHCIYSASIVDFAMQLYFLLDQETVVPPNKNTYPLIDFLSSASPPKSVSVNPTISR
jgi:hypothetical protein